MDFDKIKEGVVEAASVYGLRVLGAIAILIIGWFLARLLRTIITKVLENRKVDKTLVSFIESVSYVAMMAFVIIAAMSKLGIQTASFVAVIGAAGLAIGLALQGSLSNFAAGVLMIIFKPFKVDDFISGGGEMGVVREIGIFTTTLMSVDNKVLIIPNSKLTTDNITNFTAEDKRRVDLVYGVSYSDDLDKVRKVLEDVISKESRILADPAYTIGVIELADSSVNFAVRPWVKTADYWDVFFSLNETVKKRFDEEGISIPFPQQDVHMHTVES